MSITPEQLQAIDELLSGRVDQRIAATLSRDMGEHRKFLESMFNRVMWSLGTVIVVGGAIATFVAGKSMGNAVDSQIQAFLSESKFEERLQTVIDESLKSVQTQVAKSLEGAAADAIRAQTAQIRAATPADIVATAVFGQMEESIARQDALIARVDRDMAEAKKNLETTDTRLEVLREHLVYVFKHGAREGNPAAWRDEIAKVYNAASPSWMFPKK